MFFVLFAAWDLRPLFPPRGSSEYFCMFQISQHHTFSDKYKWNTVTVLWVSLFGCWSKAF